MRRVAVLFVTGILVCAAFLSPFSSLSTTYAQDEGGSQAVIVVGSGYIERELIAPLIESVGNGDSFQFDARGNDDGFTRLCDGSADMTLATRVIDDAEILNCDEQGVEFIELELAAEALIFVPAIPQPAVCFDYNQLSSILGAGAKVELDWTDFSPSATPGPVKLFGPSVDSRNVVGLLDDLLPDTAVGAYRTDYNQVDSPAQTIRDIAAGETEEDTASAVAFMTFAEWDSLEDKGDLTPLLVSGELGCVSPSAVTIFSGEYPAARKLMAYVNAAWLEKPALRDLLSASFGESGLPTVSTTLGFTLQSPEGLARNVENITAPRTGRTFSRPNAPVDLNTAVPGTVRVTGSVLPGYAAQPVFELFSLDYPITIELSPLGDEAAWSSFCKGEAGFIQVSRPATDAELAECQNNGVLATTVFLGAEGVVFALKSDSVLPVCLNYEQLAAILVDTVTDRSTGQLATETAEAEIPPAGGTAEPTSEPAEVSTEAPAAEGTSEPSADSTPEAIEVPLFDETKLQGPASWNQVDVSFAALPLRVLVPPTGAVTTDLVLGEVASSTALLRTDAPVVQESPVAQADSDELTSGQLSDVDYRIGAVGHLDGALTYVFWSEYQKNAGRDGVRLLQIDSGAGCITPSEETLLDGSYPFAFTSYLVYSDAALEDLSTAGLVWYLYEDPRLNVLSEKGLAGFNSNMLAAEREALFTQIEDAQARAVEAAEQESQEVPSEEPGAEATAEPTSVFGG